MDNNSASLPIQEDALKFHMRVSEVISTMLLPPPVLPRAKESSTL
jgi:hypothetical protein